MAHLKKRSGHLLRVGATGSGHLVRSCGCAVLLGYSYCRLSWCIDPALNIEESFTVNFDTPDGPVSYDDVYCGIILTPSTGTYTATLVKDSVEIGTCSITIEECTPPYPCCINEAGVNVSIEPIAAFHEGKVTYDTGGGVYARNYSYLDLSWLDHQSLRVGSMISGTKTETNCYDQFGVNEDITLATGYITNYYGIPWTIGDPACSVPGTDYYYQRIHYTFKVRYFATSGTAVRLFGVVLSEDFSIVGTPLGSAPAAPTIGAEHFIWEDNFETCGPDAIASAMSLGFIDECSGSDQILLQWWPEFISLP